MELGSDPAEQTPRNPHGLRQLIKQGKKWGGGVTTPPYRFSITKCTRNKERGPLQGQNHPGEHSDDCCTRTTHGATLAGEGSREMAHLQSQGISSTVLLITVLAVIHGQALTLLPLGREA